ncbi:MAG: alanine--tRNA ligase [Waddliaceae bacterium]|jgi:alanyl-tRNA synthetase|nr:alanine--tRNA ligase [Waddliaceae bacterium]MBT3579436.1 alanine--tRNA ligase [Waddliaceae bacterium]MBT4445189.1 alanine--tRNA ligase [Waddliaceae bacterium]MBT6928146.1 alanine--tRNA ligase [Waddliaceae bacterium]MBT7264479.1 alanine--tRNA ligase [Waddliaceae bacterium]
MKTQDIRRKFLEYFKEREHTVVSSSSVVPHDDPTLLFVNAGMNQFKDAFLGKSQRDYVRATSSQKSIRVGGKHNDLENVGHTKRHLTFFEMLGNFSFGDYFKKEAIQFAWEVSTEVFGFDPERIWPTVFTDDDEAFELWKEYVPAERITRFGEKENFWAMGDTGPCGPCSELLYDRGEKYGTAKNPTDDTDGERFLEFWNLVFMQYNREESGSMTPLPKPSVDTGAGLERIVALIMDVDNVYHTDILRSIIEKIEDVTGIKYDSTDEKLAPAFHVIADHLRTLSFAIADGAQPSNVERGYVLRKILRRAVRYGRMLGMDKPFLAKILPRLIETMGDDYQEIVSAQTRIVEILTQEEEAFLRTLKRGGNILGNVIANAKKHGKQIGGDDAFKLKDTYGLPLDEILLIANDNGLYVDIERFNILEKEARERSKQAHKTVSHQVVNDDIFLEHIEKHGSSDFVGDDALTTKAKVTAIIVDGEHVKSLSKDSEGLVILDTTTFYAEKGGQIGDTGDIKNKDMTFSVKDTQEQCKGVVAHVGKVKKGEISVGDTVEAHVHEERRQKIQNNHTATHLLHWALCQVLGDQAKQAGSVVDADRLRFDFSYHKAMTDEELRNVEDLVNTKIRSDATVEWYEKSYEEAQNDKGIKQFFGDKYGKTVRVVDIDFSKELCGGTHTKALGTIGYFRIVKEGSIAAGIRRIEAVTGADAEHFARHSDDTINTMASMLKVHPHKLMGRIEKLVEENKSLSTELKATKKASMGDTTQKLVDKAEDINGITFIAVEVDADSKALRSLADDVIKKASSGVVVLAAKSDGRCQLIVRVTDDVIAKGIKANDIIAKIAPIVDGGGGGKADNAQAGGKRPDNIAKALEKARELLG